MIFVSIIKEREELTEKDHWLYSVFNLVMNIYSFLFSYILTTAKPCAGSWVGCGDQRLQTLSKNLTFHRGNKRIRIE